MAMRRPVAVEPVKAICSGRILGVSLWGGPEKDRETNLVDIGVSREGITDDGSQTTDDVEDSLGEAGLLDKLGEELGSERRILRRLEDDGASGREGRSDFLLRSRDGSATQFTKSDARRPDTHPDLHQSRVVPRNDLSSDSDGLSTSGSRFGLVVNLNGRSLDLVAEA